MQHQVETESGRKILSLDDLSRMSFSELEALYRKGTVPSSLTAVNGAPRGRMLAVRQLDGGPIGELIRRFAASRAFPWAGKSFEAKSASSGKGINRIQARGVLGRQSLFPFETRIDSSAVDGGKTIVLDYDLADNPPYIRRVHDDPRSLPGGSWPRNGPRVARHSALFSQATAER
jgi:hypothetical protein